MTEQAEHPPPRGMVVLGVSSSIAAYKAADLTSRLVQSGIDVHVIMTENATCLVQPRTFLTLSRNPVTTSLWDVPDWRPEHIALAERAGLLAIAPATANILGKLAHGIADDALSTFALACEQPMLVAPAMNPRMWRSPAVQANCRLLRERGVLFADPEPGHVACSGDGEAGRLASPERLHRMILAQLAGLTLRRAASSGFKVLVTAGPTREHLDPVRFLSNRSSGKMGYAVAAVAAAAGHDTTLITGPTALPPPAGCRIVQVGSAAEMNAAVDAEFRHTNLLVMCAAVCDFRPATCSGQKLKKASGIPRIELERTDDILATVADIRKPGQIVVGFAAETENLEANARGKLRDKKLDMIVANDVSGTETGFDTDVNQAALFTPDGACQRLPRMSKLDLAVRLLQEILPL